MLFTAGYPPSPTFFPGASSSCFSRDQGTRALVQKKAPVSPLLCEEADSRYQGRGRQDPGLASCLGHPASSDKRARARGQGMSCHASRAGQLHKHQCTFTPTSEAWAGDQSWLPAGHPSMHKQPSFLGKCSNFACPRLPSESCPCAGTPLLQNPLFLQEIPFFFCRLHRSA